MVYALEGSLDKQKDEMTLDLVLTIPKGTEVFVVYYD